MRLIQFVWLIAIMALVAAPAGAASQPAKPKTTKAAPAYAQKVVDGRPYKGKKALMFKNIVPQATYQDQRAKQK